MFAAPAGPAHPHEVGMRTWGRRWPSEQTPNAPSAMDAMIGQATLPIDRLAPMPLHAIEPRRLYRQIADQLRLLIERGEFALGLAPAARARPRTAARRVASVGARSADRARGRGPGRGAHGLGHLCRARRGAAARSRRVRRRGAARDDPRARGHRVRARRACGDAPEAGAAARAARNDRADGDDSRRRPVPLRGDRLFHRRIAEAGRQLGAAARRDRAFDERQSNPLYEQLGSHFETSQSWAAAIAEHRAVVDAIAMRSADAAREAMRRHLANSHDRYTAGWPAARERVPARAAARARRRAP